MTETIVEINSKVGWEIYKDLQSGSWIGACEALRLTALGDTQEDLFASIFETMNALMRDLLIDDELDSFLSERGWARIGKLPSDPTADDYRFDIPIEVLLGEGVNACA